MYYYFTIKYIASAKRENYRAHPVFDSVVCHYARPTASLD